MKKLLTIVVALAFAGSITSCKKCSECKATEITTNETKKAEKCGNKSDRADFNYKWEQDHPTTAWKDVKCSDLK